MKIHGAVSVATLAPSIRPIFKLNYLSERFRLGRRLDIHRVRFNLVSGNFDQVILELVARRFSYVF
jgi:hypothetical protein